MGFFLTSHIISKLLQVSLDQDLDFVYESRYSIHFAPQTKDVYYFLEVCSRQESRYSLVLLLEGVVLTGQAVQTDRTIRKFGRF